jgi:transcriptional regulator with XRE-family HTH domain
MNKFKKRLLSIAPETESFIEKSDGIAQIISDKLQEKGWSKGKLATELGLKSQSLITRYLSGQHNFTLSTLTQLERVLDCELLHINHSIKPRLQESKLNLKVDKMMSYYQCEAESQKIIPKECDLNQILAGVLVNNYFEKKISTYA